ncbi:hypothetical protein [uncultured Thermus sp.]|nr:hypothetical protein [uncultured Thermus sp.]
MPPLALLMASALALGLALAQEVVVQTPLGPAQGQVGKVSPHLPRTRL